MGSDLEIGILSGVSTENANINHGHVLIGTPGAFMNRLKANSKTKISFE